MRSRLCTFIIAAVFVAGGSTASAQEDGRRRPKDEQRRRDEDRRRRDEERRNEELRRGERERVGPERETVRDFARRMVETAREMLREERERKRLNAEAWAEAYGRAQRRTLMSDEIGSVRPSERRSFDREIRRMANEDFANVRFEIQQRRSRDAEDLKNRQLKEEERQRSANDGGGREGVPPLSEARMPKGFREISRSELDRLRKVSGPER